MVMSDNRSDTSAERDLAREIFARSISVRLGAGESQLNAEGVAKRAFEASRAFHEVQKGRSEPITVTQQHLDAVTRD